MPAAPRWRMAACATTFVLLLSLASSCDDDVSGPPLFTLESVWPNDDGRFWRYEGLQENWEPDPYHADWQPDRWYPAPNQVPSVPSFETAMHLLVTELEGEPLSSLAFEYGLQFNGIAFTRPDATAQNLAGTFTSPSVATTGPNSGDPLLLRLAAARPDMRCTLVKARTTPHEAAPDSPLFLHGGAWQRTEDWIGTYGALDTDLAWMYLEAILVRGHQFSFQLVKRLADDVFLHAKLVGTPSFPVGPGNSPRALEVVYIVDYGISEAATSTGETLGYFRPYSIGRVFYVPNLGPVQAEERGAYFAGEASPERPTMTQTLRLLATGNSH